jgi:hypothetical protein
MKETHPMLPQILLCSALATPAGFDVVTSFAQAGPQLTQVAGTSAEVVPGVFVQVRRGLAREFRQRFRVQNVNGITVDFEFDANGVVMRNGQPARLHDLSPGDRVLLYQPDAVRPIISRIVAESAL